MPGSTRSSWPVADGGLPVRRSRRRNPWLARHGRPGGPGGRPRGHPGPGGRGHGLRERGERLLRGAGPRQVGCGGGADRGPGGTEEVGDRRLARCVSAAEAVGKYRAAVRARDELDPLFSICARCDAIGAEGGGFEEAVQRCIRYVEDGGADFVWLNSIQTREQIAEACERIPAPVMTVWGGQSNTDESKQTTSNTGGFDDRRRSLYAGSGAPPRGDQPRPAQRRARGARVRRCPKQTTSRRPARGGHAG